VIVGASQSRNDRVQKCAFSDKGNVKWMTELASTFFRAEIDGRVLVRLSCMLRSLDAVDGGFKEECLCQTFKHI
jgi:hypothetical protein